MPSSIHKADFHDDYSDSEEGTEHITADDATDPDAEFGGSEAREQLETRLLRKLDARMSILILIYILNYVLASPTTSRAFSSKLTS